MRLRRRRSTATINCRSREREPAVNDYVYLIKAAGIKARQAFEAGASHDEGLRTTREWVSGRLCGPPPDPINPRAEDGLKQVVELSPVVGLAWMGYGFPSVEVGHKLSASLMCTNFPRGILNETELPWGCFQITVPDHLGFATQSVIVVNVKPMVGVFCFGEHHMQTHSAESLASLLDEVPDVEVESYGGLSSREGAREANMVSRLVGGVALELAGAGITESEKRIGARPCKAPGRNGQPPASWVFRLTRPVVMDARDVVRRYLSGESNRAAPSFQHMVIGHYKNQPCGPGRAQRAWIHVEPYWRGDPDSPIATRSHVIG